MFWKKKKKNDLFIYFDFQTFVTKFTVFYSVHYFLEAENNIIQDGFETVDKSCTNVLKYAFMNTHTHTHTHLSLIHI